MLKDIFPHTGKALVIGITGAPGAGKSTTGRSACGALSVGRRPGGYHRGRSVKSVHRRCDAWRSDPHAEHGDRSRGSSSAVWPRADTLAGWRRATVDAVAILDAAGYNKVIIETVGVGQDEVDIVKAADVTVVVLVPGMGDGVQAMKAGIMEIGDIFAINKADREGVLRTERELEMLLSISERPDGWTPPIIKTVATENSGTAALAAAIADYQQFGEKNRDRSDGRRVGNCRTADRRIAARQAAQGCYEQCRNRKRVPRDGKIGCRPPPRSVFGR